VSRPGLEPGTRSLNIVLAARRRADQTIPSPAETGVPIIVVEPSLQNTGLGCGLSVAPGCCPTHTLGLWPRIDLRGTLGYSDVPASSGIDDLQLPGGGPTLRLLLYLMS